MGKRRRKKTKATSQRKHAKKRAMQRYGLELSRDDLEQIVSRIQRNYSIKIERQSLRVSVHTLMFKDKLVRVVYDKNRKTIVSFLPLEEQGEYEHN